MKHKFLIIFTILFLVPFVTAGLQIIETLPFKINQTIGTEEVINFTLYNAESFSFFNISFEDNSIITMDEIPELTSGASKNVIATISTNEDFSGNIKIKGIYEAHLGVANESHEVLISSYSNLTPCSFSIIMGESVIWNNLATGTRYLAYINDDVFKEINSGDTYFRQFLEPLVLRYYATIIPGVPYPTCVLTVLDDIGSVHNPEFDAILNLDVDVNYEPTTLEILFPITNYVLDVFTTDKGIFTIKNIGSETAKNIYISGEWFEFSPNNFDILSGKTEIISYKIKPIVITTNETDKNYNKTILITGNFQPIQQTFNIFINYADIDSGEYSSGDSLIDLIVQYCKENPDASFCGTEPKVIYRGGNESNMTNEQFRQIIEYWFTEFEGVKDFVDWAKETFFIMGGNINQTNINMNQTQQDVEGIKKEGVGAFGMIQFIIIGLCLLVIIGGGGYLYYHFRKSKIMEKLRKW